MTILFAGQEDLSFQGIGSTISTVSTNPITINTTSANGQFRIGFPRYSINIQQNQTNGNFWIRNAVPFASSSFWTSGRFFQSTPSVNAGTGWSWMRWMDSNGVVRLLIKTNNNQASILQVFKQDASLVQTQLGSNTLTGVSQSPNPADKIDVFINYAVSGSFILYVNGFVVFSYSGDVTTNSQTSLSYVDWGMTSGSAVSGLQTNNHWSECIVATQDTRNMSLVSQLPLVNGNTAAWTTSSSSASIVNVASSGNGNFTANTVYYFKVTTSTVQSGSVASVQCSLNSSLTGNLNMALYSDSGGSPLTRLAQGSPLTNPGAGTQVFSLSGVTILANTSYWIALVSSATINLFQAIQVGVGTQSSASFPSTAGAALQGSAFMPANVQVNFTQPNVSLSSVSQSGPDYSSTATQVQQYQTANAIPTGTFSVVSVIQHGQCTLGPGAPQHVEFGVRTGGSDFFSPDLSPTMSWSLLTYNWDTNPNTVAAWQQSDLAAGSTSFNLGYKATT